MVTISISLPDECHFDSFVLLQDLSDREEKPREGKFRSSKKLSGLVVTFIVIVVFVLLFFCVSVTIAFAKVCK